MTAPGMWNSEIASLSDDIALGEVLSPLTRARLAQFLRDLQDLVGCDEPNLTRYLPDLEAIVADAVVEDRGEDEA